MNELMRRGGVLTLLRGRGRHFKRKSTPQPATPMTRSRQGRFNKLQPRSQSLGSLSVIRDGNGPSPARYEPITNHRLRQAASVHYLGEEIATSSTNPPDLPRLRRTQCSMLCLGEDEEPVVLASPAPLTQLTAAVLTNTNNNHIYADLELDKKKDTSPSPECKGEEEKEQIQPKKEQIRIEINQTAPQNSIDAHLDRIDELNRVLDDRLKRTLQPSDDVNAIESAEENHIQTRKLAKDPDSQTKRSSSSSSECRSSKDTSHSKKRSLSFSQKSISNIFSNLKEFSKSPLVRMGKNHILNEEQDAKRTQPSQHHHSSGSDCPTNSSSSSSNNNNNNKNTSSNSNHSASQSTIITSTITTTITTTTTTTPSKENSRLKFKVPKIQKKSKAIRNTFRSKLLNFQLKRSKPCKQCTKRRRIHPSKSVFDFAKEFEVEQPAGSAADEQFCNCPPAGQKPVKPSVQISGHKDHPFESSSGELDENSDRDIDNDEEEEDSASDDVLSMKDHCYCVPSLAASVSYP